ncbi:MAG: 30S ribosomal protein S20 [Rubrobacteraceae bacterium]
MPAPSKRDKQSLKRHEQNRAIRSRLRNLSKNFYRAMDSGDAETAREIRDVSQRAYAKAAAKGVIHRNKASRKISRFDSALADSGNQE